jgi:hypothetical protein
MNYARELSEYVTAVTKFRLKSVIRFLIRKYLKQ